MRVAVVVYTATKAMLGIDGDKGVLTTAASRLESVNDKVERK